MLFTWGMIVLSICATINYALVKDWPRTLYWACAAGISLAVLRMK